MESELFEKTLENPNLSSGSTESFTNSSATTNQSNSSDDEEMDHVTEIVGTFGPFHATVYTLLGLTISIHYWQMTCNKFLTYPTDFHCSMPQHLENTVDLEMWLNMSSPILEGNIYDRCNIFDIDYQNATVRPEAWTKTRPCTSWQFQNVYFSVRYILFL